MSIRPRSRQWRRAGLAVALALVVSACGSAATLDGDRLTSASERLSAPTDAPRPSDSAPTTPVPASPSPEPTDQSPEPSAESPEPTDQSPEPTAEDPSAEPSPEPFEIPPDGMALPAYEVDAMPAVAYGNGKITGDAELGCVWIVHWDGVRQAALWEPGHWARFDPLRVYDKDGEQVWQEDEFRDYGGYSSEDHVEDVPEQCRTGSRAFLVSHPTPPEPDPGRPPPDESPPPSPTPTPLPAP